ncbi:MAG: patatin-like phospholipase RssA [Thiohalomonadaceae bacterium]
MKIGLALGSGSARGWAHIGIIRALNEHGIEPHIVCGTSIGALVGAVYASGRLDEFETWVRELDWWSIVRFMDPGIAGGGFMEGEHLMKVLSEHLFAGDIADLPVTFATVATNLRTGHEVWLQQGPLMDAVRASIALPGLFTPVRHDDSWLVDGGLVNPVPVSLCRSLGAEVIIAVNLNGDIVGRHLPTYQAVTGEKPDAKATSPALWDQFTERLQQGLKDSNFGRLVARREPPGPGLFDVIASSINIMQDRITRSRMAGDPPDVLLAPRLGHIGLLEFDRADEAITEGRRAVERMLPAIRPLLKPGSAA